ncbi:MAG: PTS system mannose/fructose/sorbose family transporter subunit IID [Elusimicrobia bacterium]|nr:PTS system mannose/fructose/sorbose family transporter subunit IID [Elusimicrobiota bacterium]
MSMETEEKKSLPYTPAAGPYPLFSIFLRSFFIQAGWNYERSQNVGFAFALLPALRRVYGNTASFYSALLRHLEFFNTQPYMAGFVLGNVAKMEEKLSAGTENEGDIRTLTGVKQALAQSFAAIGDRIFWGRLKPMTIQVCLIVWTLGGFYGWLLTSHQETPSLWLILAGPLSGAAAYSAVAVYWRWKGIKLGFECGGSSSCGLEALNWSRFIRRLSVAGFAFSLLITLAALALFIIFNCLRCSGSGLVLRLCLPAGVLILHRIARKFGYSVFFVIGLVLAASLFLFLALKLKPFSLCL